LFIEDEDRCFGDSPRGNVELIIFWKLAPPSRTIIECIEPTNQSLAPVSRDRVDGSPGTADVAYRKTGLRQ